MRECTLTLSDDGGVVAAIKGSFEHGNSLSKETLSSMALFEKHAYNEVFTCSVK